MSIASIISVSTMNPSAWWGLLGMLIPFIIHLLSKKEKTIVPFGSLQFLKPTESSSARSIQLSEPLLLFLRCLIVGVVAALIVGPLLESQQSKTNYWITDEIYNDPDYAQLIEDIPEESDIHVYSHNLVDTSDIRYFESSWTLIHHLNLLADSSIVYSHSLQKDFKGNAVEVDPKIKWNVIPLKEALTHTGVFKKNGQAIEWKVLPETKVLSLESTDIESEVGPTVLSLKLNNKSTQKTADPLKSVIELTEDYLDFSIQWLADEAENPDIVITVGKDFPDDSLSYIHWLPSDNLLSMHVTENNHMRIAGDINKESIIDTDLPVRLAAFFNNFMTSIRKYDARVMMPPLKSQEEGNHRNQGTLIAETEHQSLNKYLLLLLIPLFIIERYISYKSDQAA